MLSERHLLALDQFANGADAAARKSAHDDLVRFEAMGELGEADFLKLLSADDQVLRHHAVQALGRLRSEAAKPQLIELFNQSQDPILLEELLEAFAVYGSPDFIAAVKKKINPPGFWARLFGRARETKGYEGLFDEGFLREQLLAPALKYFLAAQAPISPKQQKELLSHRDPMIRLNCLAWCAKIGSLPPGETLKRLSTEDPSPLVRDRAQLLTNPTVV